MSKLACLAMALAATLAATAVATGSQSSRPAITAADVSVVEGSTADVSLIMSEPSSEVITVTFRTRDRSAKAGFDYVDATGAIAFQPGETIKQIAVTTLQDVLVEGDELFVMHLHASGVSIGGGPVRITITDDD